MKRRFGLLAVLLSLCMAGTVRAQDEGAEDSGFEEEESGESAPRSLTGRPWYVSPMFSYTLADDDRGTDDGLGATISIGKMMTDGMTLEVTGFYSLLDADTGGDTAELTGAGLSALIFPMNSVPDLYGIVSLMAGQTKDHPGPIPNYNETVFDVGAGYLVSLGSRMLLRLEARYRTDSHDREAAGTTPDQNKNFYDGVFNVGLLFPLGQQAAAADDGAGVVGAGNDADNDGVPDDQDKCPGTPAGGVVNAEGCEQDSDGDGVPDRLDQCPDTPAGQQVNENGCPLDSDGDGVPDDVDECPNSPAGAKVLANGCALQGDCRKPRPGEQVDENGCAAEQKFILKGVKFEFDSDRLTEEAQLILNDVAGTLQAYPDISVELQGHTDAIGTDAYNQGLSERRANSVKTYLSGRGIDAGRMTPVGYGEAQPIDTNDTEEGREQNRRVELKVMEEEGVSAPAAAAPAEAAPSEPAATEPAAGEEPAAAELAPSEPAAEAPAESMDTAPSDSGMEPAPEGGDTGMEPAPADEMTEEPEAGS